MAGTSGTLDRGTVVQDFNAGAAASVPSGTASNKTATATVKTGEGTLIGFYVNSFTATATLKIYDNTAASGTVLLGTTTDPAVGWHWFPAEFATGLHIVIAIGVGCNIYL